VKLEIVPLHLQDATGRQRPLAELSRAELSLCLDVLARIIHSNETVDILRPDEPGFGLAEIRAFREKLYATSAPYLLAPFQEAIEQRLQLDERSFHFVATHEGQIVGTLRVTAPPFELSALSPEMAEAAAERPGHLEMGRLVVDPAFRRAYVGEKLIFGAARWLCARTDVAGVVQICREERRSYFELYGLSPVRETPFRLSERGDGVYYLMATTLPVVLDRIFSAIYWAPDQLEKRQQWAARGT
jgi:hypothetical protein